ncbi:sirohydrochlorin chelatase [Rhodococcus sp. G-MC3]|uniref:sirohydrochlorin chelatase n=1 Tax=Rhodococcus sp. G-MC3 TaxID=3046209 RepID=UPI0024B8ECB9|nr:sirohydrochlorin chelatase [Rhodococcus sp. G-MC3]MDJ0394552.1 sirohydrochlorin chelatase [Rhodococcus sp. G-MC3]
MSTLIAVAHGSRDPRSARTVGAVVDRIRLRRPDLDVRVAYLDLTEPNVETVLDQVAADGVHSAIVVPLLLGSAFHARVDLPGLLEAARIRHPHLTLMQSDVLGDDRRLVDVVRTRIIETGVDIDDSTVGIALAAVGSSHMPANQRTRALAERVLAGTRWAAAVTCFATAQNPGPTESVARLTSVGARTIVVAPWFLAPGLLTDRVFAEVADLMCSNAEALGDHPLVADVVSSRYDAAAGRLISRRSA